MKEKVFIVKRSTQNIENGFVAMYETLKRAERGRAKLVAALMRPSTGWDVLEVEIKVIKVY